MKKKKVLSAFFTLSLILCGCSNPSPTTSSDNISSQEISSSINSMSSEVSSIISSEEDKLFTDIKGEFILANDNITSSKSNSLMVFNQELTNGTFSTRMTFTDEFSDNGIIFNYQDQEGQISYYFLGFNFMNELYVSENNQGNIKVIDKYNVEVTDDIRFSIFKDEKNSSFQLYFNNTYLDTIFPQTVSNTFGYYAGGKNTCYFDYKMVSNLNIIDQERDSYHMANGDYSFEDTSFSSFRGNSLMIHNSKEFEYGEFSATITLTGYASDNGIVFGVNENNKESFWEMNVSYYFLFVSRGGQFYLGKVTMGSWSLLMIRNIKTYQADATYNIKVKRDAKRIYCYLDDSLYFTYIDANPTGGNKVGFRSGTNNVTYSDINIAPTKSANMTSVTSIDKISGDFSQFGDTYVSQEENSVGLIKDTSIYNGTIITRFIPGNYKNNGIIFRVKRADNIDNYEYYWLYFTQSTRIGLARYHNGNITREIEKYIPAGSPYNYGFDVKIVMKDNDIYCYFDNRLSFHYHEDIELKGTEVGYKSELSGTVYEKIKVLQDTNKETNEVLIFGHSYTEFWYTYKEDFSYYDDINDIGIGGSIAIQWNQEYVNEVIAYEPKIGIYWIGINDITANISPQEISNQVSSALFKIKEALPDFEVILLGVNRCPARTNFNSQISQTNNLYKKLSQDNEWIKYVDVELLYCNASGVPLDKYFTDGLHLTHTAYLMAVDEINNQVI